MSVEWPCTWELQGRSLLWMSKWAPLIYSEQTLGKNHIEQNTGKEAKNSSGEEERHSVSFLESLIFLPHHREKKLCFLLKIQVDFWLGNWTLPACPCSRTGLSRATWKVGGALRLSLSVCFCKNVCSATATATAKLQDSLGPLSCCEPGPFRACIHCSWLFTAVCQPASSRISVTALGEQLSLFHLCKLFPSNTSCSPWGSDFFFPNTQSLLRYPDQHLQPF